MRSLILILIPVTALSSAYSVWLYVSAVRGEPEWSRSMIGPAAAVSMIAACVAAVVIAIRGQRMLYPLPLAILAAGFLCAVVQSLADWRSSHSGRGGAISGDPGDRYLHDHSVRIRDITEEEYERYEAANWRQFAATEVLFGCAGLAMALQAWLVNRRTAQGAEHSAAATPPAAEG
jgi:branched-subunit amino acid ABC-type transport system permease component